MSKLNKIKTHFQENKKVYIAIGATAVVTAVATFAVSRKGSEINAQQINIFSPRPTQTVVSVSLPERSTPSKPLWDKVNQKPYASVNEAVRETGRSRASILDDPNFEFVKTESQ